jgi:hypothetical protein
MLFGDGTHHLFARGILELDQTIRDLFGRVPRHPVGFRQLVQADNTPAQQDVSEITNRHFKSFPSKNRPVRNSSCEN